MSRCAHARSTYQLTKMPECIKCKGELTIIYGEHEDKSIVKEWECMKCGRVFSLTQIKEPEFSEQDKWLSEWCKKNTKRQQKKS